MKNLILVTTLYNSNDQGNQEKLWNSKLRYMMCHVNNACLKKKQGEKKRGKSKRREMKEDKAKGNEIIREIYSGQSYPTFVWR